MESVTKNKQSKDKILEMVHTAFGADISYEEVSFRELTEGCFNAAYEVVLPDKAVILKIAPPGQSGLMSYENNIMKAEVDALRLIKANTEVPVPEVYFYDDTHSVCSSDYFFMEKLTGESFSRMRFSGSMPEEEQNRILYAIGHCNKEINTIHGSCFGYIGQKEKQGLNWKDTFLAMIADVLADGEKIKICLGISYDEVRDLVDKASFALEQVTVPQLVHWDLWEGNVFVKDGKISGIIDYERALWGDPLMEYFFRLHSYNPGFVKGYGRDLREEAAVRALLYDIYLYLIMVIETKYRNYPDAWQYRFSSKNLKIVTDKLKELL